MPSLVSACCFNDQSGFLIFDKDVSSLKTLPDFYIQNQHLKLFYGKKQNFAKTSHYYVDEKNVVFYIEPKHIFNVKTPLKSTLFVAGDFNHWTMNMDLSLRWHPFKRAWMLKYPRKKLPQYNFSFKFLTARDQWIEPLDSVKNIVLDSQGNRNLLLDFSQTGKHWIAFKTPQKLDLTSTCNLTYDNITIPVNLRPWLYSLNPKNPLGAHITVNATTYFACFAPTAKKVEVKVFNENDTFFYPLTRDKKGIWTTTLEKNYEHYFYLFKIWNPDPQEVVDPYAHQLKTPQGPGIIKASNFTKLSRIIKSKDLIIMEVHPRDLVANANTPKNVSIFSQLSHYFEKPNYIKDLGVNCVEFMPLTEFDTTSPNAYHWGYMPAHYFALSSCYGTPEEFKTCVQTLHQNNLFVILDVVFNHAGVMNDLFKWNKDYYFNHNFNGEMTNYSGCGNDLCSEAPMVKRLILDSCIHLLRTYNLDGFRFDLSELIGINTLKYVSNKLKKYKPSIVLVAEPWSPRRHIGHNLKETDYCYWNDGFREFILKYVNNEGNVEGLKYFIEGSTSFLCKIPQQSINYTESHDDYSWIDRLTGDYETKLRRTHCMFMLLFMSLGIPMIAEGQDFLRSKKHVRNTYNRGDLNILNYQQINTHRLTHDYVKGLIRFRNSNLGRLLKIQKIPPSYLKVLSFPHSSAACILFNADCALDQPQILLAINPGTEKITFDLRPLNRPFYYIADTLHVFNHQGIFLKNPELTLPPISCAILSSF